MFCPSCGKKLAGGMKFCPKCGTDVSNRTINTGVSSLSSNRLKSNSNNSNNFNKSNNSHSSINSNINHPYKVKSGMSTGKKILLVVFLCCVGLIILSLIGSFLSPDANTYDYYDDNYTFGNLSSSNSSSNFSTNYSSSSSGSNYSNYNSNSHSSYYDDYDDYDDGYYDGYEDTYYGRSY